MNSFSNTCKMNSINRMNSSTNMNSISNDNKVNNLNKMKEWKNSNKSFPSKSRGNKSKSD